MKITPTQTATTRPLPDKLAPPKESADKFQASSEPAPWLASLEPTFRTFPREVVGQMELNPIAQVGLESAEIEGFVGAENEYLESSALQTAQVDFGKIDSEEFRSLHAEFGGRSQVPYDPAREYTVRDFLPPVLQALVNQDLEIPEPVTLPNSESVELMPREGDKTVDLTMNCHATTWEAALSYQADKRELNVFLGDMVVMDSLLVDLEVLPSEAELKPGDIVAFEEVSDWERITMLLHTAVYVGGGLYFEKPNTEADGEDSPYRLATKEMLERPIAHYTDNSFKSTVHRPKTELSSAVDAFGSSNLKNWAIEHGELGLSTCAVLEQSLGGGVLGEYATALAPVGLAKGADGTYSLDC